MVISTENWSFHKSHMFMLHSDKAAGKNYPVSERLRAKLVTIRKDQSIFIGLICLHLLPIWLFPFFPTQDGISHVYNAHVLCEYRNPTYHFQDFYDINWSFFPNWLSHCWLVILMRLFSPLLADFFYPPMSSVSRLLYPILSIDLTLIS